jgi:hypothetical protein
MGRLQDLKKWWEDAKERYFGARKNLRMVREDIEKTTKELREVQKRIPNSQGGVKEDLRKKEDRLKEHLKELNRRREKLADQVERRKEIAEHLEKKYKALKKDREEDNKPSGGNSGGSVGFSVPSRRWNPYSRSIPNWMIPWLDKSDANGWNGVVVSGVRTPAYSQQLCYNMCGAPTCPGRCAGIYSNHNMTASQGYPYGALDVSDYYTFERVQWAIGSPLKNSLCAADPVHFSVSGR